tara:strand:- start:122 stop:520 length:399 start_codon:yes stop_codon:yes gene_type:complete
MQGLLIENDDKFDITIYVGRDSEGEVFADEEKEALSELDKVDTSTIDSVSFTFRRPAYKDEVNLFKNAVVSDGVSVSFDPSSVRYQRLRTLLIDWSLKESEEKTIPVNYANIDRLHPRVAGALLNALDKKLS